MTQWVIITMHHAHQVGHLLAAATLTPIASWGGQNFHAEQRQCIANREALPTLYPPAPHIDTAYGSMLARSDTSMIPAQRRAFAPPPGAEKREAQPSCASSRSLPTLCGDPPAPHIDTAHGSMLAGNHVSFWKFCVLLLSLCARPAWYSFDATSRGCAFILRALIHMRAHNLEHLECGK